MPLVREGLRASKGRGLAAKVLLDDMQAAVSPCMPSLGRGKGGARSHPHGGCETRAGAAYTLSGRDLRSADAWVA